MSNQPNGDNTTTEKEEEFADQAEHLAGYKPNQQNEETGPTQAVRAKFVTPLDEVIVREDGGRLPVEPIAEAEKLNRLKEEAESNHVHATNGVKDFTKNRKRGNSSESRRNHPTDVPLAGCTTPFENESAFPTSANIRAAFPAPNCPMLLLSHNFRGALAWFPSVYCSWRDCWIYPESAKQCETESNAQESKEATTFLRRRSQEEEGTESSGESLG